MSILHLSLFSKRMQMQVLGQRQGDELEECQLKQVNWDYYLLMAHFGGYCNNLMNSSVPPSIVALIQKQIGHISYQFIEELIQDLSSNQLNRALGVFENFYKVLVSKYEGDQRLWLSPKVELINMQIVTKASKINEAFAIRLKNMLNSPEFKDEMRGALEQSSIRRIISQRIEKSNGTALEARNDSGSLAGKSKSGFNFEVIKEPPQKYQHMNLNKLAENRISQNCKNIYDRPPCLCLNEREILTKDQFSFQCIHCNRLFHTACMKKKSNSEFCVYCHLEKMVPVKRVVKTVYIGLFRRNVRKHLANVFFPHIEQSQKLQVRSIRLKEGAPTSCLFPDITEININGRNVKELEPINRQSCLKYRKDEPFTLIKGEYYPGQENTLMLSESLVNIREKDIRYESESHLLGIFVIEQVKISELISQIVHNNTMGFSQSAAILNESFAKFGTGDDDITCQLVKIPLTCPLSTLKIDIPVRGIFCNHYQCFDLKNYLTLISESVNPRWNCPLCKSFAYELQVDPIVSQILKSLKDKERVQEILFFKNGDYTCIVDDQPQMERKNIRNLNIPEKKRVKPSILAVQQKPSKKSFFIPENVDVIDLDDD